MSEGGSDSKIFALEGPVTIYEVTAIRETLRDAMTRGSDLRIDLGDSGKWDLAGLQLLISCVNTNRKIGRTVRLARVTPNCRDIAVRSGLADWLDSLSE
jgi:ABC-type transporter Mla MlaB component